MFSTRRALELPVAGVLAVLIGACEAGTEGDDGLEPPAISFERLFVLERSVVLQEPRDDPIADVTDIAWWGERLAIADRMQANIKVYDLAGRLAGVIGRAGRGPGEFVAPLAIGALSSGDLGVYDAGRNVFTVFSDAGDYRHDWMVPLSRVDAVVQLPPGRVLVFGGPALTTDPSGATAPMGVVHLVDADGSRREVVGVSPAPRHPLESGLNGAVLATYDSVIVWGVRTSNVVHRYDVATERSSARPVGGTVYRAPEWPPNRAGRSPPELSAVAGWANRQMWMSGLIALDRHSYVVRFSAPGPEGERTSQYVLATEHRDVVVTLPTTVALRYGGPQGVLGVSRDSAGALRVGVYSLDPAYGSLLQRSGAGP